MTLTQVSTWFANARRRLKKENKMTWEPRNRMDDEDDDGINSDMEDHDKKDDEDENISVGRYSYNILFVLICIHRNYTACNIIGLTLD